MKKVLSVLLLVDLLLLIIFYIIGDKSWLMSGQIGFISASLVMLGSINSYRSMVKSRLDLNIVPDDGRDTLSKIEDPYELFDEEDEVESDNKTLQEVVKEERQRLKKNRRTFWEATKDAKTSFSISRLVGYLFLVMGFFYLNNNHFLSIGIYLVALFLPSLIVISVLMMENNRTLIDLD